MNYSIACGIDDNYVQHAAVMLMSLSKNNLNYSFVIYILSLNVSNASKEKLQKLFKESNLRIVFIDIEQSMLDTFPIRKTDYLSIACYLRLFLPVVLPKSVAKILYLDSDIIVKSCIADLLDLDISNYMAAACLDLDQANSDRLCYSSQLGYYNSGVFLFNISHIRAFDFMDSVLEFINNTSIELKYHDQDVLNYILKGKIKTLDHKWNMLECYYIDKSKINLFEDVKEGMEDTKIIHFSSSFKPWNFGCRHPRKQEYFNYLKMIPWGDPKLHKFVALNKLRFWAKLIIILGGSTSTIHRIKSFILRYL